MYDAEKEENAHQVFFAIIENSDQWFTFPINKLAQARLTYPQLVSWHNEIKCLDSEKLRPLSKRKEEVSWFTDSHRGSVETRKVIQYSLELLLLLRYINLLFLCLILFGIIVLLNNMVFLQLQFTDWLTFSFRILWYRGQFMFFSIIAKHPHNITLSPPCSTTGVIIFLWNSLFGLLYVNVTGPLSSKPPTNVGKLSTSAPLMLQFFFICR